MPTMSNEHATSNQPKQQQQTTTISSNSNSNSDSASAPSGASSVSSTCPVSSDLKCDSAVPETSKNAAAAVAAPGKAPLAMSSCAVHATVSTVPSSSHHKNGPHSQSQNEEQAELSSSSSSSSKTTSTSAPSTTTTSESEKKRPNAKPLKGLLKKRTDTSQDIIRSHNKRIKFAPHIQVFVLDDPDVTAMPQIIALRPPAELSLMEFQQYMFEPPAEYQDFLTFEPPPDYRDFMSVFSNEVTFDYIEDDGDTDSEGAANVPSQKQGTTASSSQDTPINSKRGKHISSLVISNDASGNGGAGGPSSKWLLDNNLESLEEEQIIGVLKEDAILQAIGSQMSLPVSSEPNGNGHHLNGDCSLDGKGAGGGYTFEMLHGGDPYHDEQLSSEDFPVHHQLNSYLLSSSGHLEEEEEDACYLDSSPNGSLQDLASDSSITSQDTIILINQNKSFHLDLDHQQSTGDSSGGGGVGVDNIYENVHAHQAQFRANGEHHLGLLSSGQSLLADEHQQQQQHHSLDGSSGHMSANQTQDANGQTGNSECLYENTSALLANVGMGLIGSGSGNHVEERLAHSSEESAAAGESSSAPKNNHSSGGGGASTFKQNLLFYENMLANNGLMLEEATAAAAAISASTANMMNMNGGGPVNVNNGKQVASGNAENGRCSVSGPTGVRLAVASSPSSATSSSAPGDSHSATGIPVHRFPVYAIVDTNRASSTSSLSSTSSSSSASLLSASNAASVTGQTLHIPQTLSVVTAGNGSSTSLGRGLGQVSVIHQSAQVSPNSSSTSSGSSSSGQMAPPEYHLLQYGGGARGTMMSQQQATHSVQHSVVTSTGQTNFAVPSSLNEQQPTLNLNGGPNCYVNANCPPPMQQQQHSPRPSGPVPGSICVVNNGNGPGGGQLRPGQVLYRYPYAFIQHSAANGVQTIRPVQYILQTNPQTGQQSVIYNPRFLINPNGGQVNGQQQQQQTSPSTGVFLSSAAANGGQSVANSSAANHNGQQQPSSALPAGNPSSGAPPQQMTGHGPEGTSVSIPVRRILVPPGTVLGPRLMHLHSQHKAQPPPYQYYVQQRQQQAAAVFAYQQGGTPLRPNGVGGVPGAGGPPMQGQVHPLDAAGLHHGHTEFPNPSEIRRRDGLYAYPQVLRQAEDGGQASSQGGGAGKTGPDGAGGGGGEGNFNEEKDELEEFVQQEQKRTDRIKKRYSFTEEDDPTFGFARRPSVRGIRPKFGTTSEIIQQMTMQKAHQQQGGPKVVAMTSGAQQQQQQQQQRHSSPISFSYGTLPKNAQFINVSQGGGASGHPQMISIIKQMGEVQLGENGQPLMHQSHLKTATLPRQLSSALGKVPNGDAVHSSSSSEMVILNGPNGPMGTLTREQLKVHLQKQLERQMHQQQQQQQQQQKSAVVSSGRVMPQHAAVVHGQRSLGPSDPSADSDSPNGGANLVLEGANKGVIGAQGEMAYYSLNV